MVRTRLAVLVTMALAAAAAVEAGGPGPRPAAANLEVPRVYEPMVDAMWQASATFRRQWRRLAADPRIRVAILALTVPGGRTLADARTQIVRGDGPSTAFVWLPPSRDFPRLLAHELEHVLEQLDGVDLGAHIRSRTVWSSKSTGFETQRAIDLGVQVAREVEAAASDAGPGMAGVPEERPIRLVQQEARVSPASPRTSRVSADGRYVVLVSSARLVPADRDARRDVYVFDRLTGRYSRESGAPGGGDADGDSRSADISGDGRIVVFESEAGNLGSPACERGTPCIYLRDRHAGTTRLLTTDRAGAPAQGWSRNPVISADGAVVAFESNAAGLAGPSAGERLPPGVYAIRVADDRRTRVDVDPSGRTDGPGMTPAISADGRFVAFASKGRLLGASAHADGSRTPRQAQVYVRDLDSQTTTLVSRNRAGATPDGASYDPAISGDGRFIAFVSEAGNLRAGASGGRGQVYLLDRTTGDTVLVSRTARGRAADGPSLRPAISADGGVVAFQSIASDLDCSRRCGRDERDTNLLWDVFVHERATGRTRRATSGGRWLAGGRAPSLDAAGRVLALASAQAFEEADAAHDEDVFLLPARPTPLHAWRLPTPDGGDATVR
jgi:Tol biopolymer transport system component